MSDLNIASKGLAFGSFLFNKSLTSKQYLIDVFSSKFSSYLIFEHDYCPMKDYYSKEMGEESSLSRFFICSLTPIDREELVSLKVWSDKLEKEQSVDDKRVFNFDVGLISLENFILATGKSYSHRVYLSQGVYADLTLQFEGKSYQTLPWTYPDYSHAEVVDFLNYCRNYLHKALFS